MAIKIITTMDSFFGCTPFIQEFSVGEPETIFSRERMVGVNVQRIDGSLYALNDKGRWKWFGTNLVKIVYSIGPRENLFDSAIVKSELQGLPDAYTNTKFEFAEDHLLLSCLIGTGIQTAGTGSLLRRNDA